MGTDPHNARHDAPRAAAARPAAGPALALLAVFALTAVLYSAGLTGPVVLDDHANLAPLAAAAAGQAEWLDAIWRTDIGPLGRPVSFASFALNWVSTGDDVRFLKATNLLVHLLCGGLVFWLSGVLAAQPLAGVRPARRWWLALWIAAVWLVSPLLVSTVLYVVQRMTALSALFTLAGLLCYTLGRERMSDRFGAGLALVAAAFAVCWPLAVFSKENGLLLPLLALLVEWCFFARPATDRVRCVLWAVFGAALLLPAALAAGTLALESQWLLGGYATRDFTLTERLLSEPRILFDYLANLLLLPGGTPMGIYHDDFPVSRGPWSPATTLPAVAAWTAVVVFGVRARRTRAAALWFGPLFFVAAHALESSIFPLELYFEHRNYLPSVGVWFAAGLGLARLGATARPLVRASIAVFACAVPLGLTAATFQRVLVWQSWDGILLAAERYHPRSPRVHTGLASLRAQHGDRAAALAHLDRAAALSEGRQGLGIGLQRVATHCQEAGGVPDTAYAPLAALDGARIDPYAINAAAWLAGAAGTGACPGLDPARLLPALRRALAEAERTGPGARDWQMRLQVGHLLVAAGEHDAAAAELLAVLDARPARSDVGLLVVEAQIRSGDRAGARRTIARLAAQAADPDTALRRALARFERELDGG